MNISSEELISTIGSYLKTSFGYDSGSLCVAQSSRDNLVLLDQTNLLVIRISLQKKLSEVNNEARLMEYLHRAGFPTAAVLGTDSANFAGKEYPMLISRYIRHDPKHDIGDNQISEAAKTLGNLHNLTKEYCDKFEYLQQNGGWPFMNRWNMGCSTSSCTMIIVQITFCLLKLDILLVLLTSIGQLKHLMP